MSRATIGLRPYREEDAPALAEVFRAAIDELAAEDYDDAQREAWASIADDEDAFAARMASLVTVVAVDDGEIVGFVSLKGAGGAATAGTGAKDEAILEMLYVHPGKAGEGVGATLVKAIEKLAAAAGVRELTTEASDTAMPAFRKWGYEPVRRNTVMRAGEWLANTTMRKRLAPPPAVSAEGGRA